jgi:hypothetical protein
MSRSLGGEYNFPLWDAISYSLVDFFLNARSSEMFASVYQTTRRHITQDDNMKGNMFSPVRRDEIGLADVTVLRK